MQESVVAAEKISADREAKDERRRLPHINIISPDRAPNGAAGQTSSFQRF
jgi:hypothetical protein